MGKISTINGLKYLRISQDHDLTQLELAEKLGVNVRTISMVETGKQEPSGVLLLAIAEYFDVDPRTIFHLKKENE